jgi:hypothetical protein
MAQGQPTAQVPIIAAHNIHPMGSLSQIFNGSREKAQGFIKEVKGYIRLNNAVPGFNSPIMKIALVLTLIKGSEVEEWTKDIGTMLDQLDPADNIPALWDQFLEEFKSQFQDSNKPERACKELQGLHMTFPHVDNYISKFEGLARTTGYTQGSPEVIHLFLAGLPCSIVQGMMAPPTSRDYRSIK